MEGFRSLGEGERVHFVAHQTDKGWEALRVKGFNGDHLHGSDIRPLGKKKSRKIRCFNCGAFGGHIASKCRLGPQPKSCYACKQTDHLISACPHRNGPPGSGGDGGRRQQSSSADNGDRIQSSNPPAAGLSVAASAATGLAGRNSPSKEQENSAPTAPKIELAAAAGAKAGAKLENGGSQDSSCCDSESPSPVQRGSKATSQPVDVPSAAGGAAKGVLSGAAGRMGLVSGSPSCNTGGTGSSGIGSSGSSVN